tara:strand:+ start:3621 stop:3761 length:141 start_codon:yes stop_codon:yes gene_type:complete
MKYLKSLKYSHNKNIPGYDHGHGHGHGHGEHNDEELRELMKNNKQT